ncbi:MAG: glycosyl hydrolase family 28-related protein, partial [Terriglobia bacterium]
MNKLNRREFLRPMAASTAALLATGSAFPSGLALPAKTGQNTTFNIRQYGAKGDKVSNDAPAIQAAIDACNRAGGGEVVVPPGNYFSGGLIMKSNVTLRLE